MDLLGGYVYDTWFRVTWIGTYEHVGPPPVAGLPAMGIRKISEKVIRLSECFSPQATDNDPPLPNRVLCCVALCYGKVITRTREAPLLSVPFWCCCRYMPIRLFFGVLTGGVALVDPLLRALAAVLYRFPCACAAVTNKSKRSTPSLFRCRGLGGRSGGYRKVT